jgi:hypothetical protein
LRDISSQREISALLNSSQTNETLTSNSLNNLIGNWSFAGYYRGNFFSAKADLDRNSSYTSNGTIQVVGDRNQSYQVNGTYKLVDDRMLLYFVSDDGIQSVYLLENIKHDSFYAFNPNSFESYLFLRIS